MPKNSPKSHIRVKPRVWDAVFDRKLALESVTRKPIFMGEAVEDLLKIHHISEFVYWFELNCEKLGFTKILPYSIGLHPTFQVERDGEQLNIALELRSSDFPKIFRETMCVDIIVCLENDETLPLTTITVDLIEFKKQFPFTFSISKQLNAQMRKHKKFDWVKFLREKIREQLKELKKRKKRIEK